MLKRQSSLEKDVKTNDKGKAVCQLCSTQLPYSNITTTTNLKLPVILSLKRGSACTTQQFHNVIVGYVDFDQINLKELSVSHH